MHLYYKRKEKSQIWSHRKLQFYFCDSSARQQSATIIFKQAQMEFQVLSGSVKTEAGWLMHSTHNHQQYLVEMLHWILSEQVFPQQTEMKVRVRKLSIFFTVHCLVISTSKISLSVQHFIPNVMNESSWNSSISDKASSPRLMSSLWRKCLVCSSDEFQSFNGAASSVLQSFNEMEV